MYFGTQPSDPVGCGRVLEPPASLRLPGLRPACLRFQAVELVSGTGPLTVVLLYVPIN